MTKVRREGDTVRITVRCFAVPHGDDVIAKCIDLDLAVVRPTLDEARRELQNQVGMYLQSIGERGWTELLSRPAPLSDRALFYVLLTLHHVHGAWDALRPLRRAGVWDYLAPVPAGA